LKIENKSKQLYVILYMSRESVVAHPQVNKIVLTGFANVSF